MRGTLVDRADRNASPSDVAALKGRYEEYCWQQISLLLEIIPREAIRPLLPARKDLGNREGAPRIQRSDGHPAPFLP